MKKKIFTTIMAGALTITAVVPLTVEAGRGNGGQMGGTSLQTQTRAQDRDPSRLRDQSRLRYGSCTNSTTTQAGPGFQNKRGNTYGPGDGTGNGGVGPKDGTGYGAPSQR